MAPRESALDDASRAADDAHAAMFIEEICLDGFKSYAKRTVISGFDEKCACARDDGVTMRTRMVTVVGDDASRNDGLTNVLVSCVQLTRSRD